MQAALQVLFMAPQPPDVTTVVNHGLASARLTFGFDPVRTIPPYPHDLAGQSTAQHQYAVLLGGLAQLLAAARLRAATGLEPAIGTGARLEGLAPDLTDGVVEGRRGSQVLTLADGTVVPSLIPDPQTTTLAQVATAPSLDLSTDTSVPPQLGVDSNAMVHVTCGAL